MPHAIDHGALLGVMEQGFQLIEFLEQFRHRIGVLIGIDHLAVEQKFLFAAARI